jgi:hypothetical protein
MGLCGDGEVGVVVEKDPTAVGGVEYNEQAGVAVGEFVFLFDGG